MGSHQRSFTGVSGGPKLLGSGGAAPFNGLTLAPLTWGPIPHGKRVTNSSAAIRAKGGGGVNVVRNDDSAIVSVMGEHALL